MWFLRLLLRRLYTTCFHSAEGAQIAEGGSKLIYVNVAVSHLDKGMAVRATDEVFILSPELLY